MRSTKIFLSVILVTGFVVAGLSGAVVDDEHAGHDHAAQIQEPSQGSSPLVIQPTERPDGMIDLGNKICPVSGHDVSGEHFFEHGGVNYGMCCKMCARDFEKTPEKFAVSMETVHQAMGHTGHAH